MEVKLLIDYRSYCMVNINEIKYYGQWYRETPFTYHWWWYSTFDERIYNVDELIKLFSFNNYEDIENSFGYIPLWKTDLIEAAKHFVIQSNDKIAQRFLSKNCDDNFFCEFDDYVSSNQNYFTRWWYEYEETKLINDAIMWCKENHIAYCLNE